MASQEVRERVLIPKDSDPCIDIPDTQYSLLEVIGCSRQHGIPRPFLTSKYMKIDARSTFFFVKSLQKKGLITIQVCLVWAWCVWCSLESNLLFLVDFIGIQLTFLSTSE